MNSIMAVVVQVKVPPAIPGPAKTAVSTASCTAVSYTTCQRPAVGLSCATDTPAGSNSPYGIHMHY